MNTRLCMLSALVLVPAFGWALTQVPTEELVKRQARSVHLTYAPAPADIDEAEVTIRVTESQTNSYFMALGWARGYCGLQDWGSRKIFIFSVWEPSDPFDFSARADAVDPNLRARCTWSAPGVNVSRFGGEGTGVKTLTDINWRVGDPVDVRITTEADGTEHTAFTCFVRIAGSDWVKLATISTLHDPVKAKRLEGVHSFVEDYWRNYVSAGLSRRCEFSNVRMRARGTHEWMTATSAYFTGDSTPATNVDAGWAKPKPGTFFLKTGGATQNVTTPLWKWIK